MAPADATCPVLQYVLVDHWTRWPLFPHVFLQTGDLKWSKQFWTWNITLPPMITPVDYPRLSHCRMATAEFVHHVTVCARLATWRRVDDMASGCLRFVVGKWKNLEELEAHEHDIKQASDSIELLFKCSDIYQISLAQSLWHGSVSCWEKASTIYHIIIFKYEEYVTSRWRARSSA